MNVHDLHARLATLIEEGHGEDLVFVTLTGREINDAPQAALDLLDDHNWEVHEVTLPGGPGPNDFVSLYAMTEAELDLIAG